MRKYRVIRFLILFFMALIITSFMLDLKYWYIVFIITLVCDILSFDHLSVAVNYPTEENKDKSDLYNWRLWLWILVLGVGVVGMIFCFATANWKLFFVWLLLGVICCYRLSKFFKVENNEKQDDMDVLYEQENNSTRKKNEIIVVSCCIGFVAFILFWMMSQL